MQDKDQGRGGKAKNKERGELGAWAHGFGLNWGTALEFSLGVTIIAYKGESYSP